MIIQVIFSNSTEVQFDGCQEPELIGKLLSELVGGHKTIGKKTSSPHTRRLLLDAVHHFHLQTNTINISASN